LAKENNTLIMPADLSPINSLLIQVLNLKIKLKLILKGNVCL